jgi:hypothetical protein
LSERVAHEAFSVLLCFVVLLTLIGAEITGWIFPPMLQLVQFVLSSVEFDPNWLDRVTGPRYSCVRNSAILVR